MDVQELMDRFGLNREKVAFGVFLLLAGYFAISTIVGGSTQIEPLTYGDISASKPDPVADGIGEAGDLHTQPEFSLYYNPERPSPFELVSAWRPLPPVELKRPALPLLRKMLPPTVPAPKPAHLWKFSHTPVEITLPPEEVPEEKPGEEKPGEEEPGEEEPGEEEDKEEPEDPVDARIEEWKTSKLWKHRREFDTVYVKNKETGATVGQRGVIVSEDGGNIVLALKGRVGSRITIPSGTIDRDKGDNGIDRRITLEEVYDRELTKLGASKMAESLTHIDDAYRFGFRGVAVKHLEALLQAHPAEAGPYLKAGRYFDESYAYDELAGLFARAAQHKISDDKLTWWRARFLARPFNGQLDKALELYALAGGSNTSLSAEEREQALREHGDLLRRVGRQPEAIKVYGQITGAGAAEARLAIAACHIEEGQLDLAKAALEGASGPRATELGGVIMLLGPREEGTLAAAITQLRAARQQDLSSYSAAYNLGLAYLQAKAWEPARTTFDEARRLALADPSAAYVGIGLVDHLQEKPADALERGYGSAVRANASSNAMAFYWTGLALLEGEEPDLGLARESFAASVDADFQFAEGHLRLADLAMRAEDWVTARMHLDQAVRATPGDTLPLLYLGRVAIELGELDAADDAYRRALEIDRKDVPTRESLAYVLNLRGEQYDAERAFRRIASESEYSQFAVDAIAENRLRTYWTDSFARVDSSGTRRVLRKWFETEDAGVAIMLKGGKVLFDASSGDGQTGDDRKTILDRELPGRRTFISIAAEIDVSDAKGCFAGLIVRRAGGQGGGICFGITPGRKLFVAEWAGKEPARFREEDFKTYTELEKNLDDYMGSDGILRLELERIGAQGGNRNTRVMLRADGSDLFTAEGDEPVGMRSRTLARGNGVRVGVFGMAEAGGNWAMTVDNVRIVSSEGGK